MKLLYENVFLLFIFLITVFFSWRSFAVCSIKKIFHHQGAQKSDLESGSCVLYFDTIPKIPKPTTLVEGDKEVHRFFFPATLLGNEECKRMVAQLSGNKNQNQTYSLEIKNVQKPEQGILISIKYDPGMHVIECKQFEAITKDKGLIFYIYNQKILDRLRARSEPIIRTVSLGKHPPRIFIDNGHGGADTGAIGDDNVQEKNICLHVGMYLAELLKNHGYEVHLSRVSDIHVPLDQRTTTANRICSDIFVSIHANSASNNQVHGVETFCIKSNLLTRMYSELDTSSKNITDTIFTQRSEQSYKLASLIQKYICQDIASYQLAGFNRGVKHAVAQVFFTHMPSILIELGFLTNFQECSLLSTQSYQQLLAHSIFRGIHDHFNSK